MMLEVKSGDQSITATISRVVEDEIYLDGNHPLAGKTLHFTIELLAIL
jgi:FKBP-type peptidyl-prolyl cis-trans isomerase SlyD